MLLTCPDWRPLLAHRFDPTVEAPAGWPEVEAHLEDCTDCRHAALAIDPTLVFHGAAAWTSAPGESAAILQAVRTLRRTADLETRTELARSEQEQGDGERSARALHGRSTEHGPLAAAVLFALILAFQPSTTGRMGVEPVVLVEPLPAPEAGVGAQRAAYPAAPAIEGVDRPGARVYEWGAEDLSVVMVVDESLDV